MKCPKCGSENVQFTSSTYGGGFSFLDACCCSMILGPLGLLCGIKNSKTDEFWICHDCGNRFSDFSAQVNLEREAKKEKKYLEDKALVGNQTEDEIYSQWQIVSDEEEELEKQYKERLDAYTRGTDKALSRYAGIIKLDSIHYLSAVFLPTLLLGVFLLLSFMFLSDGRYSTLTILFISLSIICIVYRIIFKSLKKKAEARFTDIDPDLLTLREKLDTASNKRIDLGKRHAAAERIKDHDAMEKANDESNDHSD